MILAAFSILLDNQIFKMNYAWNWKETEWSIENS